MDAVEGLEKMGYTHNEARVYAALVRRPGSTGYEVAKHSGVPRAKVYEVLESMIAKGAVLTAQEGDRVLYRPLPHRILLGRHQQELEETLDSLRRNLDAQAVTEEEPLLLTVRGEDQVIARAREMCEGAERSLLVAGFDDDLKAIAGEVEAARARGLSVFALQFGDGDVGIKEAVHHHISPLQHLQVERYGRWLGVVRDVKEALLAQVQPKQTTALWTRHMGVVLALTMWIQHDITLVELTRLAEPRLAAEMERRMKDSPVLRSLSLLSVDMEQRKEQKP